MNHSMPNSKPKASVLILDFGSQYTQLITRRVRELGFYSYILRGDSPLGKIEKLKPSAIILSGGPASVYEKGAPQLPKNFFERETKTPILGICYGMQLLVKALGGKVQKASQREYGRMSIECDRESQIFHSLSNKKISVWMSHGDETVRVPPGFSLSAKTESGAIAAIENTLLKIYGLQFHPEVSHTEMGMDILKNFLGHLSGLFPDYSMSHVSHDLVERIRKEIGSKDHALCALSGGVDSVVAAALLHRAIGDRLHCVFVDHGLLRFKESARVMHAFRESLQLPVKCVDASKIFLKKLKGVVDPEKKRKIIGAEFVSVFRKEALKIKPKPKFLVQGTLYPDVIESSSFGQKHSVTIKTHHNVGGLPKKLGFELIEPLRDLFKDEVRKLGAELEVPSEFLKRHPFPGPGLAVRILGAVTVEALEILRHVDEVFISSLKEEGLYDQIWQAFAVFLPLKSVGVQGDGRTHSFVVALRAVTSFDGMTADWFAFSPDVLARISNRICNEVRSVNRVVYDISSKPPATIEWE